MPKPKIPATGTRLQVYNGKAKHTSGGLTKANLVRKSNGTILSVKEAKQKKAQTGAGLFTWIREENARRKADYLADAPLREAERVRMRTTQATLARLKREQIARKQNGSGLLWGLHYPKYLSRPGTR